MNLENLLRFRLPPEPGKNREGMEQRGYVEILAAPEPHPDHVLVRRERLLQFLRLRRRVQRVLRLAEINSAEIEPRCRVIRISFGNTLQAGFGIRVTQFA